MTDFKIDSIVIIVEHNSRFSKIAFIKGFLHSIPNRMNEEVHLF